MKSRYTLLLLPAVLIPIALVAQGPLTPPGAPAPTGKTLQQIEPRTDVATLTGDGTAVFVISAPGSYYLSGNVAAVAGKAGIAIAAAEVALDLNGFAITGVAGATRGVEIRNGTNGVTVRNGAINGIGAGPGVGATAASFSNAKLSALNIRACAGGVLLNGSNAVSVEDVRVTGSTSHGIDLGSQSVVTHCIVENTSGSSATNLYGIHSSSASGCRVSQLANTGGPAVGISALHVSGSDAEFLSGTSGTLFGISAGEVQNCRVGNVSTSGAGSLAGIAAGNRADECVVTSIGTTGGGGPIGINGNNVSRCEVNGVGSATSTIALGISSTGFASHCTALNIGNPASTSSVTGIFAPFTTGCRVDGVKGSGTMVGISGDNVTGCGVVSMTQTAVAASASVTGISSLRITDCQVYGITGASAGNAVGYNNYRMASGCTVTTVTNSGTGLSEGFQPSFDGLTLNSTVTGVEDVGILAGQAGCVVRGCTIVLTGISAGTGISISTASAVVEDNTVRSCNTGINVTGANGLIVHNRVTTCTTKINASATSQTGPIVTATGTIASTNPWANFTD